MDVVLIKIKEKTLLLFHHLNQEWLLIMSPVTQDGSTAIYEAKNKTKIFSSWESGENSDIKWSMLRMLTKSEGGNKENELVARHDCSSSRRTRLTRTNAKPGARIHEARARATLNNAGRVSGGCVCLYWRCWQQRRWWADTNGIEAGAVLEREGRKLLLDLLTSLVRLPLRTNQVSSSKRFFSKFPTWADLTDRDKGVQKNSPKLEQEEKYLDIFCTNLQFMVQAATLRANDWRRKQPGCTMTCWRGLGY